MTTMIRVHPVNPQQRLIERARSLMHQGGVIVYPTDSGYALGCSLGDKDAVAKIRQIRNLDANHNFTLLCKDLSEISVYARVDNAMFRYLKAHTPGAYTFILPATREVPRRLMHPKRKTIGIRIPESKIASALLHALDAPLMSVSLNVLTVDEPLIDPDDIYEDLKGRVEVVVDGGICLLEPTTLVDLTSGAPEILRAGKGRIDRL